MKLLTIFVRELRVLCRKRGTYGMRIALAIPVLMTGMLFSAVPGNFILTAQATVCQILFAFGAAFATSDAINSERKEGTLGLLLLTPLRSYQVLLGKLLTRISQFLLCLWAVVPILALPLLAGGVDPDDVAKLIVGILADCLLGMTIGLCASVISKSFVASACLSFASLLGLYIVPPVVAGIVYGLGYNMNFYWWGPIVATFFAWGIPIGFGSLSFNLAIIVGLSLCFVLISNLLFSLAWNLEKNGGRSIAYKKDSSRKAAAVRSTIGDMENPPQILHSRYHRGGIFYRIGTGMLLLLCLLLFISVFHELLSGKRSDIHVGGLLMFFYLAGLLLVSIAYLRASLDAPALIYEDRKTGMLELLLIAPLSRMATLRGLGHPAGTQLVWNRSLILAWHLFAILMWGLATLKLEGVSEESFLWALVPVLAHMGCVLTLPIELLSISKLGLWLGLKTERPLKASHSNLPDTFRGFLSSLCP